ncbi:MAG: histidinol-phosphatase [Bacillus subtilis]|nr:histidinol-phosphatase [Bacillus subtilis]
MKLRTNYHTHTQLCGHAIGMTKDYVAKAIQSGYTEIGMSDHGPIPRSFMTDREYEDNWLSRQMDEMIFHQQYLPDLADAIRSYGSKIAIRTGLEIEYLSGHDEYFRSLLTKVEYLLLGVHYFETEQGIYNTYNPTTPKLIEAYATQVEKALATGFYSALVHPDLFLCEYKDNQGRYVFDKTAELVSRRIIEAAIKHDVYLEINIGGMRKVAIDSPIGPDFGYPRFAFWKIVESYPEAKIILGCDAHRPSELADQAIEEAFVFANQFSFPILTHLEFKRVSSVPFTKPEDTTIIKP